MATKTKPKKLKVLSAKKLGLTQAEWRAGRWVRKQLHTDAIYELYEVDPITGERGWVKRTGNILRMTTICDIRRSGAHGQGHKCGTAACIGGWWSIRLLGYKPTKKGLYDVDDCNVIDRMAKLERRSNALYSLFYNYPFNVDPLVGVQALDNFFAGYRHPWHTKDGNWVTSD